MVGLPNTGGARFVRRHPRERSPVHNNFYSPVVPAAGDCFTFKKLHVIFFIFKGGDRMATTTKKREGVYRMNGKQHIAAAMEAQGKSDDEILLVCFGEAKNAVEKNRQKRQLKKWRELDEYQDAYRRTVRAIAGSVYGKALAKISEQIDSDNPWVAQNAAREILSRYGEILMGKEDKSITVKIDGMPTLGTPEDNGALPDGRTVIELPEGDEDG